MSEEDVNRKIEFLIEQQAQFVADIQSLREVQAADSAFMRESYRTLTGAVTTIVSLIGKLTEAHAELTAAQARTDAKVAELAEALARTDERLAQTDERLNIFINVVERYISRNGGHKPEEGSG